MSEYHSLSHSKWDCKYHVVFIPKKRKKVFFGDIRKDIGQIFHELAKQKGCNIIEGHLMADHVHMVRHAAVEKSCLRSWIASKNPLCHQRSPT